MAERPAYLKPEDGALLTSHDADYMVEQLKVFEIEQVGSIEWLAQHEALNKLNLQAHYNTMAHNDEFVMGALISHDKMGVLMHELLVIEIWMEKIFPILLQNVTEDISTMPLSLAIHHEASITNLLEVIMFHQDACEAMGSESLLELADYCYRKLMYLNTEAHKDKPYKGDKCTFSSWNVCIDNSEVEKYVEGKWMGISKEDHFKVTKSDAQLRKHLNEILHDQIPILKELQWVLEEISLHVKPKFEGLKSNPFILEQVPLLREKVLVQRNWDHIAKCQLLTTFSRSQLSEGHVKELLRMFEFAESMEAPNCAACGAPSTQRCSRCKGEWYCGKACQKKLWTIHRKICDILKAPN